MEIATAVSIARWILADMKPRQMRIPRSQSSSRTGNTRAIELRKVTGPQWVAGLPKEDRRETVKDDGRVP